MPQTNPELITAKLVDLRPTQMTIGLAEVALKRKEWREQSATQEPSFLASHCFPGVRGPNGNVYITDHHHLGRALIEEGADTVFVTVQLDLSAVSKSEFWTVMDHKQWVHAYDSHGHRCSADDIPKKLTKLADDPFRSLAAELRRAGGYAKDDSPFSEFLWADFLRRRISSDDLEHHHDRALKQALSLCHSPDAEHLPGWSGKK